MRPSKSKRKCGHGIQTNEVTRWNCKNCRINDRYIRRDRARAYLFSEEGYSHLPDWAKKIIQGEK